MEHLPKTEDIVQEFPETEDSVEVQPELAADKTSAGQRDSTTSYGDSKMEQNIEAQQLHGSASGENPEAQDPEPTNKTTSESGDPPESLSPDSQSLSDSIDLNITLRSSTPLGTPQPERRTLPPHGIKRLTRPFLLPDPPQPPSYYTTSTLPPFTPTPSLILNEPPLLDPVWLVYEATYPELLAPKPVSTPAERRAAYSLACRHRNAARRAGPDAELDDGIKVYDTYTVQHGDHEVPIRSYNPVSRASGPPHPKEEYGDWEGEEVGDIVIYYHGGGLYVGDLDSEDLTCRRICKELGCTVYSVEYRLMPEYTADDAVADAMRAFLGITSVRQARRLVLVGSSSGGQLAAQVSQKYRHTKTKFGDVRSRKIHGVLLRGPVTCDATEGGVYLPPRYKEYHTSMTPAFHTSLLSSPALTKENRTTGALPLEGDLKGLPRHWIQVCTNDIYYSDGVMYAEALRENGVEVEMDVVEGFPHTFWLKAPELERATEADRDMIDGLRWLLESPLSEEDAKEEAEWRKAEERKAEMKKKVVSGDSGRLRTIPRDPPGEFIPLSDLEFEKKFAGEDEE